ncbi:MULTISPECIES: bifunctional riboflavin kinase/FAD synthetase [Methylobacterium]|jgi:riboflavin kinase/FMN adenylyltransferase|uniref:Riboflavin biosynthesis protein n=1 Tax=Methylobacterium longum TaxID=767694 RepID=A0ABT8AYC4_9HYPH|nr:MULTISPECIES: bifunctional riboflavin kinase/FAD synthetase [Methylobacterium]MCJ2100542.1 bifunctional riboflavin kinase/FAD synthetase [Methylobacterium sp. E-046]MDN3574789.1 bifunctional riboflavin kinase/FAD synthetase [Methylobacterium longum]GJE11132.1 Bifunctional riboflavin kinase/FMN adenylyltransferase [Methylobacterium longum]
MVPGDETAARPFTICGADMPVPPVLRGAIAAIGNFDGVHLGHRRLVERVRDAAREAGRPAVILTFEPHPRAYFMPDAPMFRLTGPAAKEIVFNRLGLDGLIVRRFDSALAETGAGAFVRDFLKASLGLSGVVVGHDFHFGRGREGTPAILAELCRGSGMSCRIVAPVALGDETRPVSSSAIREALAAGDVVRANALLGYRWFVLGPVRHGDKRGRELGFPTANMRLPDCGLAHGIYAVRVRLGPGRFRDGVASYGRRPTFDDGAPLLETYLFDFSGDLYGQEIAVEFIGFIRGEERFASADALVERMHVDADAARAMLARDETPSMLI